MLEVYRIQQGKEDPDKPDHTVGHQECKILVMSPQSPFGGKGTSGLFVIFVKGGFDIAGTHAKDRVLPENVQSPFKVQAPLGDRMTGRVASLPVNIKLPEDLIDLCIKAPLFPVDIICLPLFDVPDVIGPNAKILISKEMVNEKLADLETNKDLSQYIL